MFSYYTIASANEVLPKVIKKFNTAVSYKNEIIKIEQELSQS